jgi:hypothetical protein
MVATTDLEIEVDGLASVNGEDDASNKENEGSSLGLQGYNSPPPPPTSASRRNRPQKPDETAHHQLVDDDSDDNPESTSLPKSKPVVRNTYGSKGSGSAKKTKLPSHERQTQLEFLAPPMRKAANNASRAITDSAVKSRMSPTKKRKDLEDATTDASKKAKSNPVTQAANSGNSMEPIDIGDDED